MRFTSRNHLIAFIIEEYFERLEGKAQVSPVTSRRSPQEMSAATKTAAPAPEGDEITGEAKAIKTDPRDKAELIQAWGVETI